jgi:hypothetical protein
VPFEPPKKLGIRRKRLRLLVFLKADPGVLAPSPRAPPSVASNRWNVPTMELSFFGSGLAVDVCGDKGGVCSSPTDGTAPSSSIEVDETFTVEIDVVESPASLNEDPPDRAIALLRVRRSSRGACRGLHRRSALCPGTQYIGTSLALPFRIFKLR